MLREAVKKMHFPASSQLCKIKESCSKEKLGQHFHKCSRSGKGGRGYSLVKSPKKVFPNHHQYLHEKSIFFYSLQKQIPVNALIPVKGAMIIFLPGGIVPPWWLT